MDLSDMYESEAYKELRAFYERLPIAASTKQVLDARPEIFKKLAAAESLEKQQEVIALIRKEEDELLKDDPVYVKVTEYIEAIGEESLAGGDYMDDLGEEDVQDEDDSRHKGIYESMETEVTGYYDTMVTRRGDIVFLNSRGRGTGNSYQTYYAKDWTHVGLYAMDNQVYDSYPGECPANAANNTGGVALRNAGEYFFKSGSRLMMAQLSAASQRPTQSATLTKAQNRFGTDCRTPFSQNVFDKYGTSSFYCSKLVWRAHKDSDDYPVDLDSNSYLYFYWLNNSLDNGRIPLGFGISWFIVFSTVSPDEIAMDGDVNNYARYRYP